ncbi:hypothetical protein BD311DRAFT_350745 [Dichomitus squalens]|uniref:Uncharacterized protein n=1 Tax=Dichomitus squalens TaxID=114155 RepID=A0A4Q9N4Y6_9APHY|nr:hypothetical protein BD311DRAFT_350745 [Dichomitus squalens]
MRDVRQFAESDKAGIAGLFRLAGSLVAQDWRIISTSGRSRRSSTTNVRVSVAPCNHMTRVTQCQLSQHPPILVPPQPQQKPTTSFIGSISDGITDTFLNKVRLPPQFSDHLKLMRSRACGPIMSCKRVHSTFGEGAFEVTDCPLVAIHHSTSSRKRLSTTHSKSIRTTI